MLGLFQHEVGGAVVNEIDRTGAAAEAALDHAQVQRIGDDCLDSGTREDVRHLDEFGIEELLLGTVVDDGNPRRTSRAALLRHSRSNMATTAALEVAAALGHLPIHGVTAGALGVRGEVR